MNKKIIAYTICLVIKLPGAVDDEELPKLR